MHAQAGGLACDPLGVARARRDLAVERHRRLERDERQPRRDPVQEHLVEPRRLLREHAAAHLDARLAEHRHALARDLRIRILHGNDDARDARLCHSLGAGARASVVGARLERHIERRPAREVARHAERVDLRVRRSRLPVPALCDDAAVAHDDRADERIRARTPLGMARDAQGLAHVIFICHSHHLASFSSEEPRCLRRFRSPME